MGNYLKLSDNSGLSLIATVLALLLFSLFIAVAVSLVTTGSNIGLQEEQGVQAFYIAEGGLEKASYYIINQKDSACTTDETCACDGIIGADFTGVSLGAGTFTVTSPDSDQKYITTTTLNSDIDAIQTSIPVNGTTGYAASGRIRIDREVIEYTSLTAASFEGCKRGVAGTTAASHASGTRVGQKQCTITSTGTISTNPFANIQRKVSTVAELQEGWAVEGVALPTDNLRSVHCTDANNCWAVGDNGTIARWNGTVWNDVTASLSPTTENLRSVYCFSVTDCWAVGDPGGVASQRPLILKWDGATWSTYNSSSININQPLNSVYCFASNNCWAVGDQSGGELILKWDGAAWSRLGPFAAVADINLNSVFMVSAKEVWIVGDDRPGGSNAVAYRWRDTNSNGLVENGEWTYTDPGIDANLNSVFMFDTNSDGFADDGWAVGNPDGGEVILRWNGAAWSRSGPSGGIPNVNLNSVHCTSTSDCWTVGNQSGGELIIRWNGASWSRVGPFADIPNENLSSVYMVSATDGWAVGDNGTIARWNGTNWSLWTQPSATILRWNSSSWRDTSGLLPSGTNELQSVSMLSYADGWAVGNPGGVATQRPLTLRWNGASWTVQDNSALNINRRLNSVYCVASNDCWAVGNPGGVAAQQPLTIRWNGISWAVQDNTALTINLRLNSVYCVSSNDCWAVGNPGGPATQQPLTLKWNGASWTAQDNSALSINQTLNSVYCTASNDCWAVGNVSGGELILRWNGAAWSRVGPSAAIPDTNLNSVFCVNNNDCWAVGNTGTIIRWNGAIWGNVASPTTQNLNSVYMVSGREGWAVGAIGTIIKWNGNSWSSASSPTTATLNELYIIGTTSPKGQWREVVQ